MAGRRHGHPRGEASLCPSYGVGIERGRTRRPPANGSVLPSDDRKTLGTDCLGQDAQYLPHECLAELPVCIHKRIMRDRLNMIRAGQDVAICLVEQNPTWVRTAQFQASALGIGPSRTAARGRAPAWSVGTARPRWTSRSGARPRKSAVPFGRDRRPAHAHEPKETDS